MGNSLLPGTLSDEDFFNLSEAQNTKPFYELEPYVHEFAPEYRSIIDNLLRRENVKTKEITKIMHMLIDELVPFYESDGSIADAKMAKLHEILVEIGKQL